MLPVEVENAFAEIYDAVEECPGVYYVSAKWTDEPIATEYYIVERDTPVISDEAKFYGKPFPDSSTLLLFPFDRPGSGDKIVSYEIQRYRDTHGIQSEDGVGAAELVRYSRELYPNYFGDFPAPLSVLGKTVFRYKALISGVFVLETEDYQHYVAVADPVWSELSDFTMNRAKWAEGKSYAFFDEQSGCLALFELSQAHPEILKSPVIDQAAMMNAIWKNYPAYVLQYNMAEQAGRHDGLSLIFGLFGVDIDPAVSLENMIALDPHADCDYIRI